MDNDKQTFLSHLEREHQTTMKLIEAFSDDKLEYKPPSDKLRTARELLAIFPATEASLPQFAQGSTPQEWKPFEGRTMKEILDAYHAAHGQAVEAIRAVPDADLQREMDFWGQPARRIDALWFMLLDNIHHRGQLTVYLREAGGVVPPIYGPTAEQPPG